MVGTVSRLVSRRHPAAATVLRRAAPWVALAAVSRVKLGAMIAVGVAVPGFALVAYVLGGGGRDGGEGAVPPRLAAPDPDRRRR
ncbi:hypothetical protein [Microlunatus parietis]|uniref:hypothetical protein n=1 Tax=Microlunatus parietis TaxID=682979 RepID=UPI0015C7D00E|nr:hypothetical protein [Microlunatus parietis]